MKVFFVNQFALRPTDRGSLRHFFQAKFLFGQGIAVEILTSDVHYNSREKLHWNEKVEIHDNVRFRVIKGLRYKGQISRLINHLECAVKAFFYLLLKVKSKDVVIGSSPQPFLAYAAFLAARLKNARFIYEVRDLWPQTLIDIGGLAKTHPLVRTFFFIERQLARNSEAVVVLMPLAWKYFAEYHGIKKDKVVWIGQGVDSSEQIEKKISARSQDESFEFVYAGSLGAANRIEFLLEIAAELQSQRIPVRFALFGDGPERPGLEAKAAQMGLTNLTFRGAMSRRDVVREIANANFTVALAHNSPLYKFGISFNKIFDYFLARTPVIFIGDVAKNPVIDAQAGFVIPSGSAAEIGLIIRDLIALNPLDIRKLGENGYAYLRQHHDHNVTGKKLLDLIVQ